MLARVLAQAAMQGAYLLRNTLARRALLPGEPASSPGAPWPPARRIPALRMQHGTAG
jgi:hypothetical protein